MENMNFKIEIEINEIGENFGKLMCYISTFLLHISIYLVCMSVTHYY